MSDRSPHELPRSCWCVSVYRWPPIPVLYRKFRDTEWNSKITAGLRDNRTVIIWLCAYNAKAFKPWAEIILTKISSYSRLNVKHELQNKNSWPLDQSTEQLDSLPHLVLKARLDTPVENIFGHSYFVAWKCHLRKQLDYLAIKYQRFSMSSLSTWFHCHQPHSISRHRLWSWPWYFHSKIRVVHECESDLCPQINHME